MATATKNALTQTVARILMVKIEVISGDISVENEWTSERLLQ